LLGEYLAVVYEETKGRPLYIVKETQGGEAEIPPREEA
jgi:hypothetical protein